MKRYFHTTTLPGSTGTYVDSEYNYLTLPDGSYVLVMFLEHAAPDPTWTELPHLLENAPHGRASLVGFAGIVATDNTFQVAKKLYALNARFHP